MTLAQHLCPTTTAGAAADLPAVHLTALADNASALAHTTGLTRRDLLLARAQLWEQLASCSTPARAHAYRAVAAVCRQEAHLLMIGIGPRPVATVEETSSARQRGLDTRGRRAPPMSAM
jgi:hypothetical protein